MFAHNCFIFIILIGYTHGQNCDPNARCPLLTETKNVPDCKSDLNQNTLFKCLQNILKDCHQDVKTMQLTLNMKLAQNVFCKNETLDQMFKDIDNDKCWENMISCTNTFGEMKKDIETNENNMENICKKAKEMGDGCITKAPDNCREIEEQYINIAYDEMMCKKESTTTAPSKSHRSDKYVDVIVTLLILQFYLNY